MRLVLRSLIAIALFAAAPVARAGSTCEDRAGEPVRCEDHRAMPPGWTPPIEERLKHSTNGPPNPTALELGGVLALIVMLFMLIPLMPDFDGWEAGAPSKNKNDGGGRN